MLTEVLSAHRVVTISWGTAAPQEGASDIGKGRHNPYLLEEADINSKRYLGSPPSSPVPKMHYY